MSRKRNRRSGARQAPLGLLDLEDTRCHLRERFDSKEWWVFLTAGGSGDHFLCELEERFYSGPRNKHYELVVIPALHAGLGMLGLALARKTLLTTQQLADFFDTHGMPLEAEQ